MFKNITPMVNITTLVTQFFIVNSPISNEKWNDNCIFNLNGNGIEVDGECRHLGIERDS